MSAASSFMWDVKYAVCPSMKLFSPFRRTRNRWKKDPDFSVRLLKKAKSITNQLWQQESGQLHFNPVRVSVWVCSHTHTVVTVKMCSWSLRDFLIQLVLMICLSAVELCTAGMSQQQNIIRTVHISRVSSPNFRSFSRPCPHTALVQNKQSRVPRGLKSLFGSSQSSKSRQSFLHLFCWDFIMKFYVRMKPVCQLQAVAAEKLNLRRRWVICFVSVSRNCWEATNHHLFSSGCPTTASQWKQPSLWPVIQSQWVFFLVFRSALPNRFVCEKAKVQSCQMVLNQSRSTKHTANTEDCGS